jgi:CRISPR/Cas system-associated exonuclease Cas4 (RecB family)
MCEHYHPDYVGMMLKQYSWLCQKPRVPGHVSDLIMCIRQRVFNELDPQKPTEKQMNLYSSGKGIHEIIQSLLASDRGRFEKEYLVYHNGMSGSVDVYDKRYNIPLEFKTPRNGFALKEPHSYNVMQLKTYMSILGADCGCIIYQYLVAKNVNFQCFWVHLTPTEREEHLNMMFTRFENLQEAIDAQEPAIADGIYNDPELSWLCNGCPYLEPCEQMR